MYLKGRLKVEGREKNGALRNIGVNTFVFYLTNICLAFIYILK